MQDLSGGREEEKGGEMLYSLIAIDHHNLTVTKRCTELLSIMSPNSICLLTFERLGTSSCLQAMALKKSLMK